MEFIAHLFRVLANRRRIQILRLLAVLGEMTVSQIARAIGADMTRTSAHLKALSNVGLVWRRRSSRWVWYHLPDRPGHPVVARALELLCQVFRAVAARDPRQVARASQAASHEHSDRALFSCFTAFTHPRRLQILRHLLRGKPSFPFEMVEALSMSPPACLRHLDKLSRRRFVQTRRVGRRKAYALATGTGAVHRGMLESVCEHLAERDP